VGSPCQNFEWLGFVWNTFSNTLEIKCEKLSFRSEVLLILSNLETSTARYIARVTGKIISFSASLGPISGPV